MATSPHSAHPLQTLRDIVRSLEAAIVHCLDKPGKPAVHALRTITRRVEAQLELLAVLPNLPPHQKHARKALRLLKKLRRAAGRVRDLDVQRDLIDSEAAGRNGGAHPHPDLRKEAELLDRTLKHKRNAAANHLCELLKKHHAELLQTFESLFEDLAPAAGLTLTETRLIAIVREWYAQHTPRSSSAQLSPAQLHQIRKRAKLARYLAESAPKSALSAHRLAAHFEGLQQTGGKWHDWLLLHKLSASQLGHTARLPQRFSTHAENSLRAFKRRLASHPASAKAA